MARCGIGSRRHCESYIREGRVTVNGVIAVLGTRVSPSDRVVLDKKPLHLEIQKVYLAVNKPAGYLCANSDSRGRPLLLDLLEDIPQRIFHVGRLDFRSSGLIFYTNDGSFSKIVSHPSSSIEKEYLVETKQPISEATLQKYKRGLTIDGEGYQLRKYQYKTPRKVLLTLIEGKNREIRRVFEHFRADLSRIHRVRIGCVHVRGLPAGGYRLLSRKEVSWFFNREKGQRNDRGH
ncbi:MAG: rRNA pseudouridine synthase [Spirochaetaceae bacterium]|nr:MAG: rRNA pseudouridine synthase [Spirochaetaceae bacterium]